MHILKINGCAICGYDKCDWSLDFHHVNNRTKKFQVGAYNFWHKNIKSFIIELQKCILLCKNCHNEITFKEKHGGD